MIERELSRKEAPGNGQAEQPGTEIQKLKTQLRSIFENKLVDEEVSSMPQLVAIDLEKHRAIFEEARPQAADEAAGSASAAEEPAKVLVLEPGDISRPSPRPVPAPSNVPRTILPPVSVPRVDEVPRPTRLPGSVFGRGGPRTYEDAFFAVERIVGDVESQFELHLRKAKRMKARFDRASTTRIEAAENLYDAETATRLGEREGQRHHFAIVSWFETISHEESETIIACQDSLWRFALFHADLEDALGRLRHSLSPDSYGEEVARLENRLGEISDAATVCDQAASRPSAPPSRPVYGSSLGPIGSSTSWLLSTESMAVTLIVGLSGFGLLGALVSQFSRRKLVGRLGEEDTGELAVVIFTGFVAALVVYVAAYGSVILYADSGGDPNPYVVFAACLVGAIYSEDIFQSVYTKLLGRDAGGVDGNTQQPAKTPQTRKRRSGAKP